MQKLHFTAALKRLALNRKYILYSIFSGLTTLIIPLAVQFLVNNLVLAGIWVNTLTFILIISIGLIHTQVLRYAQVVINEFLQREIFIDEMKQWQKQGLSEKSYYYFEIIKAMKNYSGAFTDIVDIGLVLGFGLLTIIFFHPAFIVLPVILLSLLYWIYTDSKPAIETSIKESDRKYELYYMISDNQTIKDQEIDHYLEARHHHFYYIRKNTILMGMAYVTSQIFLLGAGIYFIQTNQLSVGQLVSAEIILSGIMASLQKFPKTMENLYDYETSKHKLELALGERV